MTRPVPSAEPIEPPDISHLVTEDGAPVDNIFSERQMRLLADSLYASWDGNGRDFAAFANVGLFYGLHEDPVVPDVMLSMDVKIRRNLPGKRKRSYFVWEYGKPPDVVIEVVSNREGGEMEKLETYGRIGVPYVVIMDPDRLLSPRILRVWRRQGSRLVRMSSRQTLPGIGIGLTLWKGTYEDLEETWLRWCDESGRILSTGEERAQAETQRADAESQRADAERQRADAEGRRADASEARLRELEARLGGDRNE